MSIAKLILEPRVELLPDCSLKMANWQVGKRSVYGCQNTLRGITDKTFL